MASAAHLSNWLANVRRWALGQHIPVRSRLFPDLPKFEVIRGIPDGYPDIGWVPANYRRAFIARGANVGFRVPDEILLMYGPRDLRGGGPPYALQVFVTRTNQTRLPRTSANGTAHTPKATYVTIGDQRVEVAYFDGEYVRELLDNSSDAPKVVPKWSRSNKHSIVFNVGGFAIGIRGPRIGGVHEFHLYAIAESVYWPLKV